MCAKQCWRIYGTRRNRHAICMSMLQMISLAQTHSLKKKAQEFEDALRTTQSLIEDGLENDAASSIKSTGENWILDSGALKVVTTSVAQHESLSDQVEFAVVSYWQKNPNSIISRSKMIFSTLCRFDDTHQGNDLRGVYS